MTEFTDSERLTIFNAIQELLLNVVKHSGVKSAQIIISKKPHARIEIKVCDKGKGFEPADTDETEYETGGFGLFMLKERLSWMGGDVNIDSRPGDGCTITLNLPFDEKKGKPSIRKNSSPIKNANVHRKIQNRSTRVSETEKLRILVADDHAVLREGLVRILQQDPSFHVVGQAPDGETAIEMATQLKPDVVLKDVMMPGIGGVQATRMICQHNPDIKVIALSMYEEREQGSEMTAAGAIAYVTKNNASDKIVRVIRSCCGLDLTSAKAVD
ncbi:MAG: response regulator [Desulfobacter sp.]|nr:response regulator [Desulfobacter sp.]